MQVTVLRRGARVVRPLAAFGVLAMLAACGSTPHRGPATASRGYHQTRSYDPPGPTSDPWGPWVREASRRFDVPEAWIRGVMRQESGGRAGATSPVGAMGLMQVMPATYRDLQRRHDLGDDPYHPYDNLMAGTAYLREMYDLYGSPAFLAAYNAGPRRLEDYLYNHRGLPTETRNYVARVGPDIIRSSPVRRAPAEVYAAAEIPLSIPAGPRRMDASMRSALADARAIREQNAQYASLPPPEANVAPVRLASAVPARSYGGSNGSLASTGGGRVPLSGTPGVVAMMPIPDGSTPEGAARIAEADARAASGTPVGGGIAGDRIIVARMDPIPDGSTPEGAARLAESAARAEPPPPPRFAPQLVTARPPVAAQPGGSRFSFIGRAQASTLPSGFRPAVATGGAWAIQVGAFTTPEQARSAAQGAQGSVGGRALVTPVSVGRATLFRARVTGLSHGGAQQACDRLRGRNGCNVISPD